VLHDFLKLIAPITPFISDYLYKRLTGQKSVHLQTWPTTDDLYVDISVKEQMELAREVVELGHQYRKANNLKVRTPLRKIEIKLEKSCLEVCDEIWEVVLKELNIKNISVNGMNYPKVEILISDDELKEEGNMRDLIREIQVERKKLNLKPEDSIILEIPEYPQKYEEMLRKKVMAKEIKAGDRLKVIKV
ncbi:MAG TPA: class I tRNA ligase family protein, partial [Candidatus Nitrosocosmicus sp.]|nr:class I tRNA ligase family protein [Candidatus Nitrosocosmicus sp.]